MHASQWVSTMIAKDSVTIVSVANVTEIRVRQRVTSRDERTRRTSLSSRVVLMTRKTRKFVVPSPAAKPLPGTNGRMSKVDGAIEKRSSANQPRK